MLAAVSEPARQQFDFEKPGKSGSAAKWSCRVPSPLVGTNHPRMDSEQKIRSAKFTRLLPNTPDVRRENC